MDNSTIKLQTQINQITKITTLLKSSNTDVSIDMTDTLNEVMSITKFRLLEKAVLKMHGGDITPITIKKNGKYTDVYRVQVKGRKVERKDYKDFIYKLADAYGIYFDSDNNICNQSDSIKITDYSVRNIFCLAIKNKKITENINDATVRRYEYEFKEFIYEDMASKDIRKINKTDLAIYLQHLIQDKKLNNKKFLKVKSLLNLIFKYCIDEDRQILDNNPLEKINNKIFDNSIADNNIVKKSEIFSSEEINIIEGEIDKRFLHKRYNGYFVRGYMVKFAIHTGCRIGEICALKESDIDWNEKTIYIHAQQLQSFDENKKKIYIYANYTKDAKKKKNADKGRIFPLTKDLEEIFSANIRDKERLGIISEYVFCDLEGKWITKDSYTKFLERLLRSLGMDITNNHAFRKSLNSNVLIPKGMSETDRAKLLGHTVETNLKYYSKPDKDYVTKARALLSE